MVLNLLGLFADPARLERRRSQVRYAHHALQVRQAVLVLARAAAAQLEIYPPLVDYVPPAPPGRFQMILVLCASSAPVAPLAALVEQSARLVLLELFRNHNVPAVPSETLLLCVFPAPPILSVLLGVLAFHVSEHVLLALEHCLLLPAYPAFRVRPASLDS